MEVLLYCNSTRVDKVTHRKMHRGQLISIERRVQDFRSIPLSHFIIVRVSDRDTVSIGDDIYYCGTKLTGIRYDVFLSLLKDGECLE